ncbi:class A beta-lactamase-related serine hydrolase [Arenibacter aquaticus]|uniref:Class A beta-lactamase-related serine hydrolase n=1 Tax=Arenibacter aquaticus TaxID=2489054 RepID=A0A3S0C5Z6_9FLAO|nr:serine hydrolase domain-containing protein [Arenibacter aquaticus]RTE52867.1 class A beta-lactamase-related serine hydrolase [Arenibacter aquaticus]
MNPILTYLKGLFASQRILGADGSTMGKVRADHKLQQLINDGRIPGLAITVLKKGGVYFQKGYGYADLEKGTLVDPQRTIFRVASVSKPISAAALAAMVESHGLDLNASIYDYVPFFPKKQFDITIRQLAGHTAGIRGYRGCEYGLNRPLTIEEGLELFKDDPLLFEPGKGFLYNSYGWVLISLAMQEVSGIPFADYVREKVLEPYGMKDTFTEKQAKNNVHCTSFYSRKKEGFRKAIPVNNHYKLAGGGYLSTSSDIARFGQACLDISARGSGTWSQFLTAQTVKGESTHYGLGWEVSKDAKGRSFFGHIGNGVGGYAVFYVYPEQDMVFSIMINCTNPGVREDLVLVVDELLK